MQVAGEELPDFFAGVEVGGVPGVLATDDLIEPHVTARRGAAVAVLDDGVAVLALVAHGVLGCLAGAAVPGHPVADGHGNRQIGTPAALVVHVARPLGHAVLGAVDFHQGNGARCLHGLVDPCHRQPGNGGDGLEDILLAVGHQVAHFAAVGHAGEEGIVVAQVVAALDVSRDAAQGLHVIDPPSLLERVTHIPAGLPLGVFQPLGDAHGELVAVGSGDHGIFAPDARAIAVQDDHQGRIGPQAVGQIHLAVAHVAIDLDRVGDKSPSPALQGAKGQQ